MPDEEKQKYLDAQAYEDRAKKVFLMVKVPRREPLDEKGKGKPLCNLIPDKKPHCYLNGLIDWRTNGSDKEWLVKGGLRFLFRTSEGEIC